MNQQRIRDYKYIRNTLPKKTLPDSGVVEIEVLKFTIDDKEYIGEPKSTWEKWINSSFNTDGFQIDRYNTVCNKDGYGVYLDGTSIQVLSSATIVDKGKYIIS